MRESIDLAREQFSLMHGSRVGIEGACLKIRKTEAAESARTSAPTSAELEEAVVQINFRNYGDILAKDVRLLAKWAGKREEVKKGNLMQALPPIIAFPKVLLYHVEPMIRYDYDSCVLYKLPLFLRVELHYQDANNEEYIHYYLGSYIQGENNFGVLESFDGTKNEYHEYLKKAAMINKDISSQ